MCECAFFLTWPTNQLISKPHVPANSVHSFPSLAHQLCDRLVSVSFCFSPQVWRALCWPGGDVWKVVFEKNERRPRLLLCSCSLFIVPRQLRAGYTQSCLVTVCLTRHKQDQYLGLRTLMFMGWSWGWALQRAAVSIYKQIWCFLSVCLTSSCPPLLVMCWFITNCTGKLLTSRLWLELWFREAEVTHLPHFHV